jgi:hypothetical protein
LNSHSFYDLAELCTRIHDQLHTCRDEIGALRRFPRLEAMLAGVASEQGERAIVYWDALALAAELRGELEDALRCRRREVELIEELHRLVREEREHPYALTGRGVDVLEARRAIVDELVREVGRLDP